MEGEFVLAGSPWGGTLEQLSVSRGQTVKAGDPLFALERSVEAAALAQAQAQLRAAQAREANLGQPRRTPELLAAEAQVDSAKSAVRLSSLQLDQQKRLADAGFVSTTALASARAAAERDQALLANAGAQLETLRLKVGREPERAAAAAEVTAASAAVDQARIRFEQKVVRAPADAKVQDTLYRRGEWVPPAAPVVSLLPPGHVKLRFFVPQAMLPNVPAGAHVQASCDGCPSPVSARVTYVSSQAEYTPPVIYSRESRAKLVYLVEALPDTPGSPALVPGQPVDVRLK